ncbi:MAG: hypothetical protein VX519_01885 [Myxococcota bacterium]|nr:hypothetical protein [Myxococcota bacterium]
MRLFLLLAAVCLLTPACREKDLSNYRSGGLSDDTSGESAIETGAESGGETGGDTSALEAPAGEGFAFCAGGGWVSGADIQGVTCTAPVDVASNPSSSADYNWQPGPITFIAP